MNRKKGIIAKKSGKEINKKGQTYQLKKEIGKFEEYEDTTKYGEFVSSYFAWLTIDKQKENANKIENMTDRNSHNIHK